MAIPDKTRKHVVLSLGKNWKTLLFSLIFLMIAISLILTEAYDPLDPPELPTFALLVVTGGIVALFSIPFTISLTQQTENIDGEKTMFPTTGVHRGSSQFKHHHRDIYEKAKIY